MDDQRVGRIVRALRRRRGLRQSDLAIAAGCAQSVVSLLERGHLERVSLPVVRRILAAIDATLVIELRWRGASLDRLVDEDHAALGAAVADWLQRHGWLVQIEVTYSEYREHGSIDILAFHADVGALLVIEIKTDLPAAEAMLRRLDEKVRLAPTIARKRYGWPVKSVSRLVVMPESSTIRRRVERHAALFDRALPLRGIAVRRWLGSPSGNMSGLWFLSRSAQATHISRRGGRDRVRRPKGPAPSGVTAT
jgi:Helix-turn-helix.